MEKDDNKIIEDLQKKYRELESSEQRLIRKLVKKMKKSEKRAKSREAYEEGESFPTPEELDSSHDRFEENLHRALDEGHTLLIDYIKKNNERRTITARRTAEDVSEINKVRNLPIDIALQDCCYGEDKLWIRDIDDGQIKGLFLRKMTGVRLYIN